MNQVYSKQYVSSFFLIAIDYFFSHFLLLKVERIAKCETDDLFYEQGPFYFCHCYSSYFTHPFLSRYIYCLLGLMQHTRKWLTRFLSIFFCRIDLFQLGSRLIFSPAIFVCFCELWRFENRTKRERWKIKKTGPLFEIIIESNACRSDSRQAKQICYQRSYSFRAYYIP